MFSSARDFTFGLRQNEKREKFESIVNEFIRTGHVQEMTV
jgi:hypothetical protein